MNRFFVLSSGNINSLNGASQFVRLLSENKEFWKNNGFIIKVLSNDFSFTNEQEYRRSLKYKAKQKMKKVLNRTKYGKRLSFFSYEMNVLGAHPVNELSKSIDKKNWILLNDFLVAGNFYKKYGDQYKTIFMMHNNGNLFSMIDNTMKDKEIRNFLIELEKLIMRSATQIVFVSESARELFIRKYPIYERKSKCIYIGLPSREISVNNRKYDKLRLVTVGTICSRKNQISIIRGLKELEDEKIELTVVGGGTGFEECSDFIKKNNLDKQVHLVGAQKDVRPFLQKANTFIMASNNEGLPVAAQEAMRAKLPLILTDVGGCKELIEDNGILINPDDKSIKYAINYLQKRREYLIEMGKKSYELFQDKFTLERMRKEYLALITGE